MGCTTQAAREELQGALADVDQAVQQVDVRPLTDLLDGVGQPLHMDGSQASVPEPAADSEAADTSTANDAEGEFWFDRLRWILHAWGCKNAV